VAAAGQAEVFAGGLAENGRSGIQQPGGDGGVVGGHEAFQRRGAVHHRHSGQRDVVLKRHGAASQLAGRGTLHFALVIPGIERIFFAVRAISGGAWVARRGDLVGQGVDEIVGVEVGLHQRQIFFGLCGRQSHMQPTGEFLQLFDGRTFNSHGVPFIWCVNATCLQHKPETSSLHGCAGQSFG
jgi:hypothetical protein